MARKEQNKRYFTPAEANNMLPLIRVIVKDIVDLAHSLRDQNARLERLGLDGVDRGILSQAQLEEELASFEKEQEELQSYLDELRELGVGPKDLLVGLVDFPGWVDDREVCLCWKLGEAEVAWWHEINAGFRGRQPLPVHAES